MILGRGSLQEQRKCLRAAGVSRLLGVLLFPLVARAFGIIASIVGIMVGEDRKE